jgi:PTH1 family peptidyl-tRNA hydrolase
VKLIVGLGNPGQKYARTRHNIGFMVLDRLAERLGVSFSRQRFEGDTADSRVGMEPIVLLKPNTFMNLSGRSVGSAVSFFKITLADIMVVLDELDLPFGRVRFKHAGGSAGHNGLKSITAQLGAEYLRLRMGIGRPPEGVETVNYVLAAFESAEQVALSNEIDLGVEAVRLWLEQGLQPAMQDIHRKS